MSVRGSLKNAVRNTVLQNMLENCVNCKGEWKVMIVDEFTTKYISSACRMFDLTERGVTLVENLSMKRKPMTEFDAVYFLNNNAASLSALLNDWEGKAPPYGRAHVFFTSRISDQSLSEIRGSKIMEHLATLKEVNMEFSAIEENCFSLDEEHVFEDIYAPETHYRQESQADLVKKLLTVCVTLGDNPVIRHNLSHTASGDIANQLSAQLGSYAALVPEWRGNAQTQMLILDRTVDPLSPLLHEYTYQAMAYDLLRINKNMYTYEYEDNTKKQVKKTALLSENDELWSRFRHKHIAETLEELFKSFNAFTSENPSADMAQGNVTSLEDMSKAVKGMGKYKEAMAKYTLHINLAQTLMAKYETDSLEPISEMEQNMACGADAAGDKVKHVLTDLIQLLQHGANGKELSSESKLRLLMMYIITQDGIKETDRQKLVGKLGSSSEQDENAIMNLQYLGVNLMQGSKKKASGLDSLFGKLGGGKKKAADDAPDYDLSRYVTELKHTCKELLDGSLSKQEYPFVKEPSGSGSVDDGGSGRGKASKWGSKKVKKTWASKGKAKDEAVGAAAANRPRLIVFMIGGMCYSEMRVAYELSQETGTEVIVGSSHVLTPKGYTDAITGLSGFEVMPSSP